MSENPQQENVMNVGQIEQALKEGELLKGLFEHVQQEGLEALPEAVEGQPRTYLAEEE